LVALSILFPPFPFTPTCLSPDGVEFGSLRHEQIVVTLRAINSNPNKRRLMKAAGGISYRERKQGRI